MNNSTKEIAMNASDESIIVTRDLTRFFPSGNTTVRALDGVTIGLPRGKLIAIRGSSGSGKTTLLNMIGALDKVTSGSLIVDGTDVSRLHGGSEGKYRLKKVGFVFQSYCLIPNMTALENVMLPMELLGGRKSQRQAKAQALLERVGIDVSRQARRPAKLSGGEQQRVAIARALANDPPIILADEPTGNLDSKTGRRIVELLHGLVKEGKTVIIATHSTEIAARANMVLEMTDGKITESSVPRGHP